MELKKVANAAKPLLVKDGIRYELYSSIHGEQVIQLNTDVMYEGEQLSRMMGGDRASIELNNQKTDCFYLDNGLSVVAIDEASGKLAGALCAKDSDPEGVGCGSICSILCMLCKLYCRNKKLMSVTIGFTSKMGE